MWQTCPKRGFFELWPPNEPLPLLGIIKGLSRTDLKALYLPFFRAILPLFEAFIS
jgi:hypothetical protein